MSTLTLAILALVLLIGPALVALALDACNVWGWGTETYTISTRELPNIATPLPDTGRSGAGRLTDSGHPR